VWDNSNGQVGLTPHKTSNSTAYTVLDIPEPTSKFSKLHILLRIKNFFTKYEYLDTTLTVSAIGFIIVALLSLLS
jgi:hypothetical protein